MNVSKGSLPIIAVPMAAVLILLLIWFPGDRPPRPTPDPLQQIPIRIPLMRLVSYRVCRNEVPENGGLCFSDVRLAADYENLHLRIPRMLHTGNAADGQQTWRFQVRGEGAKIESCDDSLRQVLRDAGMDDPETDFIVEGFYDRQQRRMRLERLKISVHGQFTLEASCTIIDFDMERALAQPADIFYWLSVIPKASLAHGVLSYQDDVLAQRMLERYAEKTAALQNRLQRRTGQSDVADPKRWGLSPSSTRALLKFLAHPAQLTATLGPSQAISFSRFLQPESLKKIIALLDVKYKPSEPFHRAGQKGPFLDGH
jgi:hypothetical protein